MYAACSGRIVELPFGRALFQDRAPRSRDHNVVRVTGAQPDLSAAALAATVESLQADLPHRFVEVSDEATAERLLPSLEATGWEPEPILLMDHRAAAPERPGGVDDAEPAELEPLRAEWLRSGIPASEHVEEVIEQVHAADAIMRETVDWQAFCVRDAGRPVAMAWVLGAADEAMVEDVYVSPSHRGRGLGAAVVTAAVAAGYDAGADLVYLATDAQGLARPFYRHLGFGELAVLTRFLKRR